MPASNGIWFLKCWYLGDILIQTVEKNILFFSLFFLFLLHLDSEVANGRGIVTTILLMMMGAILDPTLYPSLRWWWTSASLFHLFSLHYVSYLFYPLFCMCLVFQLLLELLISLHFVKHCQRWPNIISLWLQTIPPSCVIYYDWLFVVW